MLFHLNKHYGTKDSWEEYPHETPNKYAALDKQRIRAIWHDGIHYQCVEITEVQHAVFAKVTQLVGHSRMLNDGMDAITMLTLFGKATIKSMIKKGVFELRSGRLYLTKGKFPSADNFIKQAENGVTKRETSSDDNSCG